MTQKFSHTYDWSGPTFDANDEHFGNTVEQVTLEEAAEYDAVLVGEPTDEGQVSVRGAALGPEGLREGFAETKTAHLSEGNATSVADLGDMDIPWGEGVIDTHEQIKSIAAAVHDVDTVPIFLGGGHDLAYPNVAPLIEHEKSVGVINFDAHADVREVLDKPYNGSPFRQAFEDGLAEYTFIGGRHFETSMPYVEFMREHDCAVISSEDVAVDPRGAVKDAIKSMGAVDTVHVSCDLDVLDMSVAPGTTAPTPGGLLSRELYTCLRTVMAEPRVTSLDIIGCAPPLESSIQRLQGANVGPTAMAGARAIAHAVHGVSNKKQ